MNIRTLLEPVIDDVRPTIGVGAMDTSNRVAFATPTKRTCTAIRSLLVF